MEKENLESGKVALAIIGVVALIVVVVGSTMAWFRWQTDAATQQTAVDFTTSGIEDCITYTPNIPSTPQLTPVAVQTSGIVSTFTVSETCTQNTVYVTFKMTPTVLDAGIKHASVKYEFKQGATSLATGDFSTLAVSTPVTLATAQAISGTTPIVYTLYIWIDGEYAGGNPSTLYNANWSVNVNAEASEQAL